MLVLKTKFQKVSRVEFAPDGRGLAAAGKHGTYWWPSAFENPKPTRFGENECGGIGFSADGSYLIALHQGYGVCSIDLTHHTQQFSRVGKFGSTLAVCHATGLAVVESWTGGSMSGWRVGLGGHPDKTWELDAAPGSIGASIAFAADGSWFVRAGRNPSYTPAYVLVRHDSASGREIDSSPGGEWVSCGPVISPDGMWVAFGSAATLFAKNITRPERSNSTHNENSHQFTDIAFHPSGHYLAATNNDATVKLYDTTSWQVARTYTWDIGRMRSIAFSPDGTLAAAGSDTGKVVVWDVDV
jgi:WD40 repeat protein